MICMVMDCSFYMSRERKSKLYWHMKFSVGHYTFSSCGNCEIYPVSTGVSFAWMKQLKFETDFLTPVIAEVKNMCFISVFLLCLLGTVYRFCVHVCVNIQSTLGQSSQ